MDKMQANDSVELMTLEGELILTDEGATHSIAFDGDGMTFKYLSDAILQYFGIELEKGRWRWRVGRFKVTVEKLEEP